MGMKHCPGLVNLDAALPLKLQRGGGHPAAPHPAPSRWSPLVLPVTVCCFGDPGAQREVVRIPTASTPCVHGHQQSQDKCSCSSHSVLHHPTPRALSFAPCSRSCTGDAGMKQLLCLGLTWQPRYHPAAVACVVQNPWDSTKKHNLCREGTKGTSSKLHPALQVHPPPQGQVCSFPSEVHLGQENCPKG